MARLIYSALTLFVLSGCAGIPKDAFLLSTSSTEDRQLQSRSFATGDQASLLIAGKEILQDMGYTPETVATDFGLVTAARIEQRNGFTPALMSLLGGASPGIDKDLTLVATLTTMASSNKDNASIVRITFQRVVFDSNGEASSAELVRDAKIYKMFYERLEAAVFVDADKI